MKEIKTTFSDKMKSANAKWRIESSKQEKQNTADFMIEFETLAMKANIDKLYTIFLLKKNMRQDIIKIILGYPPIAVLETLNVKITKSRLSFFLFSFLIFIFLLIYFLLFYF